MRIAVLGCGSIGRRHMRNLRALGEEDVIGFDPSGSARSLAASEGCGECVNTLEGVWKARPDIVLVAAPSDKHIELAQAAARHRCHLFIESDRMLSYAAGTARVLVSARLPRRHTIAFCRSRYFHE